MTPLRARLFNPPNALPDTGIHMRNGWPTRPPARPAEPPVAADAAHVLRIQNERQELAIRRRHRGPRIDPTVIPTALRWSTQLGCEPNIVIPHRYTTPRHIIFAVAKEWDIRPDILTGSRREAFAIVPRHAAMAVVDRLSKLSLVEIGKHFGGRCHHTVWSARRKMGDHISALNQELTDWSTPAEWVRALKARLEA